MGRIVVAWMLLSLIVGGVARAAPSGTDASPVILGRTKTVVHGWTVKVLKVYDDPRDIDPSADWFTGWLDQNPPAKGEQILTLRLRIGNVGKQAGDPLRTLSFDLVSATGYVYDLGASCGTVPGNLGFGEQLDSGESIDGNLCWYVKTKHLPSLKLHVSRLPDPDSGDGTWFALSKAPPTPTVTTEVQPLAYSVVSREDVSIAGRTRWVYRIVVAGSEGASDDAKIATMTAALTQAFREHSNAKVVTAFAYLDGTDTGGEASFERAEVSSDKKGWAVDGDQSLLAPGRKDDGRAEVYLVTEWDATIGYAVSEELHLVAFAKP